MADACLPLVPKPLPFRQLFRQLRHMSSTHLHGSCSPYGFAPSDLTSAQEAEGQQQERTLRTSDDKTIQQLIRGIEVIQTVQSMDHDVPLVAKKPTLVRVYLNYSWPFKARISGTLRASLRPSDRRRRSFSRTVSAAGYLRQAGSLSLKEQRRDLKNSLNFVLPASLTAPGSCTLQLLRLEMYLHLPGPFMRSFKVPINIPKTSQSVRTVEFEATPPLRLRMVGIRYQTADGNTYEPSGTDYGLIQSWLKRAFPIAQLEWRQTTVAGPSQWPFNAPAVNALLRGIRRREVARGTDARTHYYGLVGDGGGFMRGRASGIPTTADPSTVASGPTGPGGFGWDTDGSYGDWYTGHELGHTLGRFHAEFCGAGGGRSYPFAEGQLSDADEKYVGLDYGDGNFTIAQRALPGVEWHDMMTYCRNQWLSSFTYSGIHQRLLDEEALPGGAPNPGTMGISSSSSSPAPTVQVIATVNLTQKTGQFQHVTAASELVPDEVQPPAAGSPSFTLKLYRQSGELAVEQAANYYPDACSDDDEDTGIVDMVIPSAPDGSRLELLMDGQVLDTFNRGATATPVSNVRSGADGISLQGLVPETLTISWDDDASGGIGIQGESSGSGISYVVELSKDGGATWEVAGFDQPEKVLEADPSLFEDVSQILVRITSSDGFKAETVTQTIDLD